MKKQLLGRVSVLAFLVIAGCSAPAKQADKQLAQQTVAAVNWFQQSGSIRR